MVDGLIQLIPAANALESPMVNSTDAITEMPLTAADDPIHDESEETDDIPQVRYDITSFGVDFDVVGLVRRLEQDDILIPKWQRSYIWNIKLASSFVESLLLGLPVPGVFIGTDPDSEQLYVIDGQQRLKTLQYFYRGEFPGSGRTPRAFNLIGVQSQFDGISYDSLDLPSRRRLDNSLIHATVVRQDSPPDDDTSMYQIFKRLNTGGRVVNPQEIRCAIYQGGLIQMTRNLNDYSEWRNIVGRRSTRLKDQEMILRFMAMWHQGSRYTKSMAEFLNTFTQSHRNPDDQWLSDMETLFKCTIKVFAESKGREAFRFGKGRSVNAALFDSMAVGMARRITKSGVPNEDRTRRVHDALIVDEEYLQYVTQGTATETAVTQRMRIATHAFADA